MAAACGAAIIVSFFNDAGSPAYQVVAGLRTRNIQLNSESVDVTNANSTGVWREVLSGCGVRTASISGDGVFTDDAGVEAIRDAFFENENRTAKIDIPGLGVIDGSFKVASLEFGGEYNNAVTFSVTLESAGALAFT